jgi:isoleucyl-tRNA synthetase
VDVFPSSGELTSAAKGRKVRALIWTTTPWTLPGNEAVAYKPDAEYVLVESKEGDHDGCCVLLAEATRHMVERETGKTFGKVLARVLGKQTMMIY